MTYLLAVSILWGISFGLIKAEFSALSSSTLAASRILIAIICFVPFLRLKFSLSNRSQAALIGIGALQYGLMYLALFQAFRYLAGHEVALLTIFTPLYIIAFESLLNRKALPLAFWACALLAVLGALTIFQPNSWPSNWPGLLLMQLSNICFAAGQILYRRNGLAQTTPPYQHYALLFIGALLPCLLLLPFSDALRELQVLDRSQWLSLLYLGAVATGLGFFLWNVGATRVNPATLAVFNNLKIPTAIVIAIVAFGEQADLGRLIPGMLLMLVGLAWAQHPSMAHHYQR